MKTCYFQNGTTFFPHNDEDLNVQNKLPPGVFTIAFDPMRGPFFVRGESFTLPPKIYGDTIMNADRILNTFSERSGTTGVLLEGEKGSGKTLLAKQISIKAAELGMPTILINAPHHNEGFFKLLQGIQQPAVILIDEFEKVYHEEEAQLALLTLLDGVFTSKKLFVFTVNAAYKVNDHMKNRPGRIYYSLSYDSLDPAFIDEYCADNLRNQDNAAGVRQASTLFYKFNFDMLKAMVEEMNRYDETAQQVMKLLNTKPSENSTAMTYSLVITRHGQPLVGLGPSTPTFNRNPLQMPQFVITLVNIGAAAAIAQAIANYQLDKDDNPIDYISDDERKKTKPIIVTFAATDLKRIDETTGAMTYINAEGYEVTFTRQREMLDGYEFYSRAF